MIINICSLSLLNLDHKLSLYDYNIINFVYYINYLPYDRGSNPDGTYSPVKIERFWRSINIYIYILIIWQLFSLYFISGARIFTICVIIRTLKNILNNYLPKWYLFYFIKFYLTFFEIIIIASKNNNYPVR